MTAGASTLADDQPDRRARRRAAKRQVIIAEAWALAERDGLAAISLRDLAARVDLRQPSLYSYFESKLALYDAMFADANRMLVETIRRLPELDDPKAALVQFVRATVGFSSDNIVRHQLMFDRTIPGFQPSEHAYRPAVEFFELGAQRLAAVGVWKPADLDVFTSLVAGLARQQVAKDPGGTRWMVLIPRVVDMFLSDIDRRRDVDGSSS